MINLYRDKNISIYSMNNIIENINISSIRQIISPEILKNRLKITDELKKQVVNYRNEISDIINKKNNKLIAIVGPCSVSNYESTLEYAEELKEISEHYDNILIIMRVYVEKPRTRTGWKGYLYDPDLNESNDINKGIELSRKLMLEITRLGLPIATEFLNLNTPQYFDDLVSYACIGARTVESQLHRELASGLSMPIGFKNTTGGDINKAIDAIITAKSNHTFFGMNTQGNCAIISTNGNSEGHIILRGSSKTPNYYDEDIKYTINLLNENKIDKGIIIDCSHGNSNKNFKNQIKVAENIFKQKLNNNNIVGIMLESFILEGNQKIDHKNQNSVDSINPNVSITDECINLDETERILSLFK